MLSLTFFRGFCQALVVLKNHHIVHGNVTSNNVLMRGDTPALCDFKSCRVGVLEWMPPAHVTTAEKRAPETRSGHPTTTLSDVYVVSRCTSMQHGLIHLLCFAMLLRLAWYSFMLGRLIQQCLELLVEPRERTALGIFVQLKVRNATCVSFVSGMLVI